jgi:hypothetical protein
MVTNSRNIVQPGLRWQANLFGAKPVWTEEPSIAIIENLASKHLGLDNDECCIATAFAEGAFNKLYTITCSKGDFIFRVTLPVAPHVKTLSEVAALFFVRENTTIPVPHVIAFNADVTNELGFEYILMTRLDGRPLREKLHSLSWLKMDLLVQQIADFPAHLSRLKFPEIGSIYPASNDHSFTVGETVLPAFFTQRHVQLSTIPRGPLSNSHAFVAAHTQHLYYDITQQLASYDTDAAEDAEEMQDVYSALNSLIPLLYPPSASNEPATLYHHDLSSNNILVNDQGDLTGIVDWECVVASPLWLSCQLPTFLEGPSISFDAVPAAPSSDALQDEEAVEAYEE